MKKFRASKYVEITEIEVIKETDKTVWFINRYGREERELKETDRTSWCETKEEAINFIVNDLDKKIIAANKSIEYLMNQKTKAYLL